MSLVPEIVFEDEDVCVINKPAGMVVNDAETVKDLVTVQKWFKDKIQCSMANGQSEFTQKGGVVHRLDKDTSGVMILAKTEAAYEKLKQQFLERTSHKVYMALVKGKFAETEGIISAPIERNPNKKQKFYVGTDPSRTAITEWKVVREFKNTAGDIFTYVELKPHTGRTHQLRVHMKHLGHPIVGDPIYGGKNVAKIDSQICPRMFLHALSLEIVHPTTGIKVTYTAPLPQVLEETLEKLVH